jgi:hypothetical protein
MTMAANERKDGAERPPESGGSKPRDAGRTSGGGSLGHVQPDKVEREAPLRNNPDTRDSDDPTMPANDSSLRTKI